jgi:hypothetical protein
MVGALLLTRGHAYDNRYLLNLLLDNHFGVYENLSSTSLLLDPLAMKALPVFDPDTPHLHKAMRGDHHNEFLAAMAEEIAALEVHKTWTIVHKETLPTGANVLPGTWALKTKCYPNGRIQKHKARFCA